MDEKRKRVLILAGVVAILLLILGIFVFKDKTKKPVLEEKSNTGASEEQIEEATLIRNITGKIIDIGIEADTIKAIVSNEEMNLKISSEANFINQAKQSDGSFLIKNINLYEIPRDKEVEIQYNEKTNEVLMIIVK